MTIFVTNNDSETSELVNVVYNLMRKTAIDIFVTRAKHAVDNNNKSAYWTY